MLQASFNQHFKESVLECKRKINLKFDCQKIPHHITGNSIADPQSGSIEKEKKEMFIDD